MGRRARDSLWADAYVSHADKLLSEGNDVDARADLVFLGGATGLKDAEKALALGP